MSRWKSVNFSVFLRYSYLGVVGVLCINQPTVDSRRSGPFLTLDRRIATLLLLIATELADIRVYTRLSDPLFQVIL